MSSRNERDHAQKQQYQNQPNDNRKEKTWGAAKPIPGLRS